MRIGFDLDKVFIDHPHYIPDRFINRLYRHGQSKFLAYRIPSKPEQILRRITHYHFFRPSITENIEFLETLHVNKENHCFLISGRFGFLKKSTELFIKTHKFEVLFENMFFNFKNEQPHIFKERLIRKLRLEKYVDDDLELVHYLSMHLPKVTFYWLNNDINRQIQKNIYAISDIKQLAQTQ